MVLMNLFKMISRKTAYIFLDLRQRAAVWIEQKSVYNISF